MSESVISQSNGRHKECEGVHQVTSPQRISLVLQLSVHHSSEHHQAHLAKGECIVVRPLECYNG